MIVDLKKNWEDENKKTTKSLQFGQYWDTCPTEVIVRATLPSLRSSTSWQCTDGWCRRLDWNGGLGTMSYTIIMFIIIVVEAPWRVNSGWLNSVKFSYDFAKLNCARRNEVRNRTARCPSQFLPLLYQPQARVSFRHLYYRYIFINYSVLVGYIEIYLFTCRQI